jgi:Xaa-Pro aminopeptidase
MKSDIDRGMKEKDIAAILVRGPAQHNASMAYFTGLVHLTGAYLLKILGHAPVLFCSDMERDEAASTGLELRVLSDYEPMKLFEAAEGDLNLADAMLIEKILREFDVKGRVSIYGEGEAGATYSTYNMLQARYPEVEIVGESMMDSVLALARSTKDAEEVERIRGMGKITAAVVADVVGFLTSHQAKDNVLVDRNGDALTIGDVKTKINLWLAMRGAENPNGSIFAIGRDAGVPHSSGTDEDPIPLGETIIFDIFPCEAGGGYFYDFTRTWCLGYAPDEALALYEDVLEVYETVYESIKPDVQTREYQLMTCELFEEKGHPTICSDPRTLDGYVHSLGHSLGLSIHEAPIIRHSAMNQAILSPGTVFTIEPGLYYPDRGMGVRIEDTVWMKPDGELETLVDFPKDLVIKIPGV